MGVTHFLILSKTESAPYLRVGRTPQGPTLTFKIHEYALAVDIAQSQLRPRCPKDLFKNPPLVTVFLALCAGVNFVFVLVPLLYNTECSKSPSRSQFLTFLRVKEISLFEVLGFKMC